jgi:hypothetical protein
VTDYGDHFTGPKMQTPFMLHRSPACVQSTHCAPARPHAVSELPIWQVPLVSQQPLVHVVGRQVGPASAGALQIMMGSVGAKGSGPQRVPGARHSAVDVQSWIGPRGVDAVHGPTRHSVAIRPLAQQTAPVGQSEALMQAMDASGLLAPLLELPPKAPLLAPPIPPLLLAPPFGPPLPPLLDPPILPPLDPPLLPLLPAAAPPAVGSPRGVGTFAPSAALDGPASDSDTVNSLPPHAAIGRKTTTARSVDARRAPMLGHSSTRATGALRDVWSRLRRERPGQSLSSLTMS